MPNTDRSFRLIRSPEHRFCGGLGQSLFAIKYKSFYNYLIKTFSILVATPSPLILSLLCFWPLRH